MVLGRPLQASSGGRQDEAPDPVQVAVAEAEGVDHGARVDQRAVPGERRGSKVASAPASSSLPAAAPPMPRKIRGAPAPCHLVALRRSVWRPHGLAHLELAGDRGANHMSGPARASSSCQAASESRWRAAWPTGHLAASAAAAVARRVRGDRRCRCSPRRRSPARTTAHEVIPLRRRGGAASQSLSLMASGRIRAGGASRRSPRQSAEISSSSSTPSRTGAAPARLRRERARGAGARAEPRCQRRRSRRPPARRRRRRRDGDHAPRRRASARRRRSGEGTGAAAMVDPVRRLSRRHRRERYADEHGARTPARAPRLYRPDVAIAIRLARPAAAPLPFAAFPRERPPASPAAAPWAHSLSASGAGFAVI
jgi:hypothetical protein